MCWGLMFCYIKWVRRRARHSLGRIGNLKWSGLVDAPRVPPSTGRGMQPKGQVVLL